MTSTDFAAVTAAADAAFDAELQRRRWRWPLWIGLLICYFHKAHKYDISSVLTFNWTVIDGYAFQMICNRCGAIVAHCAWCASLRHGPAYTRKRP